MAEDQLLRSSFVLGVERKCNMGETLIECPECHRNAAKSGIRQDEYTKRLACKTCRLKTEILSSGSASFGCLLDTGKVFDTLLLWEPSKSKVLNENDYLTT